MKINIYGVGRSGTKALTLFFCSNLSVEQEIKLNYEPYYWKNRFTEEINFKGAFLHSSTPQFLSRNDKLSIKHLNYLDMIGNGNDHDHVITKFIRGNGRIVQISEVMRPDLNVIIVRDLFEVLASILNEYWNFYEIGYPYYRIARKDFTPELLEKSKSLLPKSRVRELEKNSNLRLNKNAIYWYIMNYFALTTEINNTYFIDFKKIESVENILKAKGVKIHFPIKGLKGSKISDENLLNNKHQIKKGNNYNRLNEFIFYLKMNRKISRLPLPFFTEEIGETIVMEKENILRMRSLSPFEKKEKDIQINHNSFLTELNDEIRSLVEKRIK